MSDKQIKMADVFELPLQRGCLIGFKSGTNLFNDDGVTPQDMATEAINNHDRLTAENEALREEVELLKEYSRQLKKKHNRSEQECDQLKAQNDLLVKFADGIMENATDGCDVECDVVYELAEASGLWVVSKVDGPCKSGCVCSEYTDYPTICYRKTFNDPAGTVSAYGAEVIDWFVEAYSDMTGTYSAELVDFKEQINSQLRQQAQEVQL